jgi:hypothetical protein
MCMTAQDCTDTPMDCKAPTCEMGMCGASNEPKSTPCAVNGGELCDGAGLCVPPSCMDGRPNGGETDVDCGGAACPKCDVGKQCGASDENCVTTAFCDAGECAAKKLQGDMCADNKECASGHCTDAVCCDTACDGVCSSCDMAPDTGTCTSIPNGEDPAGECAGNGGSDVCSGDGACAQVNGTACGAGVECVSGNCVDSVCCDDVCADACEGCLMAKTGQPDGTCAGITVGTDPDDDCAGSLMCMAGMCAMPLPNGTACTVNGECESGQCADGVCCNTECNGTCASCNLAASIGSCTLIPSGVDPDAECMGNGGSDVCSGGACVRIDGTPCATGSQCEHGHCVDGVCCNSACSGTCQACAASIKGYGMDGVCAYIKKSTDPQGDCNPPATCNGAGQCN